MQQFEYGTASDFEAFNRIHMNTPWLDTCKHSFQKTKTFIQATISNTHQNLPTNKNKKNKEDQKRLSCRLDRRGAIGGAVAVAHGGNSVDTDDCQASMARWHCLVIYNHTIPPCHCLWIERRKISRARILHCIQTKSWTFRHFDRWNEPWCSQASWQTLVHIESFRNCLYAVLSNYNRIVT